MQRSWSDKQCPFLVCLLLATNYCYFLTGDALHSLRANLEDPNNVLQSWDPTLVNPCTWFHVTCNNENSVIRVYVVSLLTSFEVHAYVIADKYVCITPFGKISFHDALLFCNLSDLGNAALSGQLVPQLGLLKNLQYL